MIIWKKPRIESQQDIIKACLKNDKRAQLQLYKQYSKAMFNVCYNLVNDKYIAEDLMQEAFIAAFIKLNSFKGDVTFGAWLKKIMINKCIDHLKKKRVEFENIDEHNIVLTSNSNDSDEPIYRYSAETVKQTISGLPDGYKTILNLYLFEGYDHEEIAEILHISSSTSRSQYTRAKALLKQRLQQKTNG